jgi:TusA-related sulfurtransferase
VIRPGDKVAKVLAKGEHLLEVFVAASPAFEKLRNSAMRKTMARLVTVEQAARIAGIDAVVLIARLEAALRGAEPGTIAAREHVTVDTVPAALRVLPAERIVDLDVRDDLRAGREPFRRILDAARALPDDSVLRLRAIFEPAPLYAVLARLGLAHGTECLAADDWRVWFYRGAVAATAAAEPVETSPHDDDVIVLDVRGLEPPEPMMRTLEALASMPRGKTLVQINVRVPQYLLPKLAQRGFTYEIREQGSNLVRIFIRHAPSEGDNPHA